MKVAILTQPLHNNYGGNLQNFALQKVLKSMGHEPITIDRHYRIKLTVRLKLGYFKRLTLHYIKKTPRPSFKAYFFNNKHQSDARKEIVRFIDSNINKTPKIYTKSGVEQAFRHGGFDAVIVGSDQVWRPMYSPSIYTYYLDFIQNDEKIIKLAYAASFGTDKWEYTSEQTERCKQLIQQFDLVTVREKNAIKLVKQKLNKEASVTLDPTLLLTKEDYMQLLQGESIAQKKGIYTYILDKNEWKNQVVDTVKNALALPQFSHQHSNNAASEQKIPSIEGWIKGFASADFVITDSFHGTVFAIIFNKPFVSLVNVHRGASRFESILDDLGLLDYLLENFDKRRIEELISRKIDFKLINRKLESLRYNSLRQLKHALSL